MAGTQAPTVAPGSEAAPRVADPWSEEYRSDEYLARAIADLRRQHGDPAEPMGVYFVPAQDPRSSLGRVVELERFGESFANDVPLMRELYGEFEDAGTAELICVVDHERSRPAGVIRVVRNTAAHQCRTLADLQRPAPNGWGLSWEDVVARSAFAAERPEDIIDIQTMAVSRDYSGSRRADGVSKALCAGVFRHALRSDATTWVTLLDRIPYLLIQAYTADVMEEFDGVEGQMYFGAEDTVPVWSNFRTYEQRLLREHDDLHAWLVRNEGLEDYFFAWPETRLEVIDLTEGATARR